jgi:ribosomal protein S18 acetylase RimI-like enzyme
MAPALRLPRTSSLGVWTDLWTLGAGSRFERRGDTLSVTTPANPTFRWGNLVVFLRPMRPDDAVVGPRRFATGVGTPPRIRHMTFAWDDPHGGTRGLGAFEALGFEPERVTVLLRSGPPLPAEPPPGVVVRPLAKDDDWDAALDLQVELNAGADGAEAHRAFRAARNVAYRSMVDAGAGAWFGAFEEGRLVADLGIFARSGVGRFQAVETHPDARERGIASAMVAHAGRFAVDRLEASRLVILADTDEDAIRLYRRRGFEDVEHLVGVSTPDAVRAGLADAKPDAAGEGV